MKAMDDCPVCDTALIKAPHAVWCKNEEHMFWYSMSKEGRIMECEISIPTSNIFAYWDFDDNTLLINTHNSISGSKRIPFFHPNFSNMAKLLEKLKTYMVFA